MDSKKRQMIFIGVVIAAIIGWFGYDHFYNKSATPVVAQRSTSASGITSDNSDGTITAEPISANGADLTNPPAPNDGIKKGIVEVGASGFAYLIIKVDANKNWELLKRKDDASFAYEGLSSADVIEERLRVFLAMMLNQGVPANNLHFTVSSGALKNPKTNDIISAIKRHNYTVNKVTAEQEGNAAYLAAMNKLYEDESFVFDLGSGNGKITWKDNGKLHTVETTGAKYFQMGIADADVFAELKDKASDVPETKRKKCFIVGGVPYTLATRILKNKDEKLPRYTKLQNFADYKPQDDKEKSGLVVLKGLQEGTGCQDFYFDSWAAYSVGLLLGFK